MKFLTRTQIPGGLGGGRSRGPRRGAAESHRRALGVSTAAVTAWKPPWSGPAIETLVALARGLWRNPVPLLIIAGHLTDTHAQHRLRELFEEGTEVRLEWGSEADEATALIDDAQPSGEVLRRLAFELFVGEELVETGWSDEYLLVAGAGKDPLLAEIASLLAHLRPDVESE